MAGLLFWEESIFLWKDFHKEIARVQSVWYAQQSERGIKYPKSSKHIQRLYRKKQNAVKDYLHKVTRWIAEYCRKEDIRCVVVGDIRNIRKEKDMGHKTNQKLHSLPYNRIYIMLEYKLKMYGIRLEKQKESYSGHLCDHAPEVSKKYAEPSNRKKRGLYVAGKKETAVRNRTENTGNNKSSCIALKSKQ